MKRIFYTGYVITPDGSDTSFEGDGVEEGTGTTSEGGWMSPDVSMLWVRETQGEVTPDVFEPDEFDELDDRDPAAWLAKTLGHYSRLYEVQTEGVKFDPDGTIFYSSYQHEVDPSGIKVTLQAHVEGFTEEEIAQAIYLLDRKPYPREKELVYLRKFVVAKPEVIPAGTPYCIYVSITQEAPGGFVPSVVYQGVKGHFPLMGGPNGSPWVWGPTFTQAKEIAAEYNKRLNLTEDQVLDIIVSSMPPMSTDDDVFAVDDVIVEVDPDKVPTASSYGCGRDSCQNCYPVFYQCDHGIPYPKPRINNTAARESVAECTHHEEGDHADE